MSDRSRSSSILENIFFPFSSLIQKVLQFQSRGTLAATSALWGGVTPGAVGALMGVGGMASEAVELEDWLLFLVWTRALTSWKQ